MESGFGSDFDLVVDKNSFYKIPASSFYGARWHTDFPSATELLIFFCI